MGVLFVTTRLDRLLRPKSVAVIGGGAFGTNVVEQCLKMNYAGALWPVHPSRPDVHGVPAFKSVADLPAPPDAAFVAVNRNLTIDIIRQLSAMGAGGAICFAAGFRETGGYDADGDRLQRDLVEAASAMPIIGPNCYGLINYADGALLWPDQHGGQRLGVGERGVAIITQSSNIACNLTMQQRGLPIAFHAATNGGDQSMHITNRFIATHALGFTWFNIVHMTNWVVNGIPERFPGLKSIWIESGLAWIPFLMQRLDNEYMMRSSEAPALKKLPSDYMRDMFFSTQPMEMTDMAALEQTFRMMKAETQLLYSSDYPHWDFDLPSTIYDLPFLSEQAKRNILGGNARKVFNLKLPAEKLAKVA